MKIQRRLTDRGRTLYHATMITGLICIVLASASSAQSAKIQVVDLDQTLRAARVFCSPLTYMVSDVTPEGLPFSEAMITSPGGHAILCYEMGALTGQRL